MTFVDPNEKGASNARPFCLRPQRSEQAVRTRVLLLGLYQDSPMDEQPLTPPAGINVEQLMAAYRERIIDLEAHGLPDGETLWDVMDTILAEMKRHQTPINP